MSEPTDPSAAEAASEPEVASASKAASGPRWRRILSWVLIVLACVLSVLSLMGVWARNTLLDTDRYVETVAPLASDADVQEAISRAVSNALLTRLDVEDEVRNALPERASFLAPSIATSLDDFVRSTTLRFLQSDEFERIWERINRGAHALIVSILKDEGPQTAETRDGTVTVRLGPVIDRVQERLEARGINVLDRITVSDDDRRLVLIQSEGVRKARLAVDILDTLAIVLPILTVVLFAAAIFAAPDRRRATVRAALGLALSAALVLTLFNVLRGAYLDAIRPRNQDAAAAVYDQLLRFLRLGARSLVAVGVVVAFGAWIAGPGRVATRIRSGVLGRVRRQEIGASSPVGAFVSAHRGPLRVLVVGLGGLVLVVLQRPSAVTVLVVALLVLAGLLLVEAFGRRGEPVPEPG